MNTQKEVESIDTSRFTLPSPGPGPAAGTEAGSGLNLTLQDQDSNESFWGKKKILWLFIFIIILVGAVVAGFFMYNKGYEKTTQSKPLPTPTVQQPSPTPTPKPVDLTKYSITILNGSGIAGEAARMQKLLVEKGFQVEKVGNADKSNYKETVIKAKEEVDAAFIAELKTAIGKEAISQSTADSDADTDVTIIVGSDE